MVFKLRGSDKTERTGQGQFLQERIVGAFQGDLQLCFTECFNINNLVCQLQPGVTLTVIEHCAEVFCRRLGIERFTVGEFHVITQGEGPGFTIF